MQPFRFIHASNLLLDHQIGDRPADDSPLQSLIDDCTMVAWKQVVATAIAEEVDFLLLAGNTFDERDHSLHAQLSLVRGLEQLAEHGIDVYILPGTTDPPSAWRDAIPLPDNAFLFLSPDDSPRTVACDGTPVALIYGCLSDEFQPDSSGPNGLFSIVMRLGGAPPQPLDVSQEEMAGGEIDYWAQGTGDTRRTAYVHGTVAHHPGSPQGLCSKQTGPHGCTLVEVDASGEPTLTFVPTSPLRWESVEVAVNHETSREELFHRMKSAVGEIHGHPTDEAYLLSWRITGEGPLKDLIVDTSFREEIDDHLHETYADSEIRVCSLSAIRAVNRPYGHPTAAPSGLEAEYIEQLTNPWQETPVHAGGLFARSSLAGGKWDKHFEVLAEEIDDSAIFAKALSLGHDWFAEESPPIVSP